MMAETETETFPLALPKFSRYRSVRNAHHKEHCSPVTNTHAKTVKLSAVHCTSTSRQDRLKRHPDQAQPSPGAVPSSELRRQQGLYPDRKPTLSISNALPIRDPTRKVDIDQIATVGDPAGENSKLDTQARCDASPAKEQDHRHSKARQEWLRSPARPNPQLKSDASQEMGGIRLSESELHKAMPKRDLQSDQPGQILAQPAHYGQKAEEQCFKPRPAVARTRYTTEEQREPLFGGKTDEATEPQAPQTANHKAQAKNPVLSQAYKYKAGAGGDAPVSAVNAGKRTVSLIHEKCSVLLPVTPNTTSIDLIRLAAAQIPSHIDVGSALLLEAYTQLGLERPLRKYEHIREIMNSWDCDDQNFFNLIGSPTEGVHDGLELRSVPKKQPSDTSVCLYLSQQPGKWDKRLVTLRSDGQVSVSQIDGDESTNICHLSDFDIYTPTKRQIRRIRPPRKVCFAIKSQQKSNIFMSTLNFVHFFSTGDKKLGRAWYEAVQAWRSWYLVNIMGRGEDEEISNNKIHQNRRTYERNSKDDLSPDLIFKKSCASPLDRSNGNTRALDSGAKTFFETELVGRSNTRRTQVVSEQAIKQGLPIEVPHTALPVHAFRHRDSDYHRNNERRDLLLRNRLEMQREKLKPLIDLTPQYIEPPQHAKKGRGVVPDKIPAGGLVDIATSPENPLSIPPATTWQRPTTNGGPPADRSVKDSRPNSLPKPLPSAQPISTNRCSLEAGARAAK